MLETIKLCKTYRPKRGVPVKAMDEVSLVFPEKGMVFLLGKSGSGKSTLLNLLGGLDKYDSGEIIIKGVSSKNFAQKDFDSYRNTYVGFIFQDYNILEEFSVGANIGLALELQGKKATNEEINSILEKVDLAGYGSRHPNELSGGQLQRVAIARALVKNPEIIMADEPTGALDSNTGRQVLDTLKKLSEEKLVIVVSHDREFAEKYADRIIELGDGKVISDVESVHEEDENSSALFYDDGVISVPEGYQLTEEDRIAINRYLDALGKGVSLSVVGTNRKFKKTERESVAKGDGSAFALIKSKLPMRSAFKIGAGGLKYKKFRLVMTVLLSTVAFTLFALADTFGSYKHIRTCVDSIIDSDISYATIKKSVLMENYAGDPYWEGYSYKLDDSDIDAFYEETGVYAGGVYNPDINMNFYGQYDPSVKLTESSYDIFAKGFTGFGELNAEDLEKLGYTLVAGSLPDGNANQIALSSYVCETFIRAGYSEGENGDSPMGDMGKAYHKINSAEDMIGKTIMIGNINYLVTGIVDTGFDLDRYLPLTKESSDGDENVAAEEIVDFVLFNEFNYDRNYSYAAVCIVGEGFIDTYRNSLPDVFEMNKGYLYFYAEDLANSTSTKDFSFDLSPKYVGKLSNVGTENVVWLDGERTVLGDKEIVVADDFYSIFGELNGVDASVYTEDTAELFKMMGNLRVIGYSDDIPEDINENGWKIVGYIDASAHPEFSGTVILTDESFDLYHEYRGIYEFAVGPMPENRGDITTLVTAGYDENDDVRYVLQNPVVYELDIVNGILKVLSKVFLYIGIGFALFAALLLANFIATSISYKKQEIGILRAIGSRSADVFRIFFSESFIIAMVNFGLSVVFSALTTVLVNIIIRNSTGILITVLHFGVRQIVLLLAVGIFVAAAASFFPVKRIASMRPIDAIRNR